MRELVQLLKLGDHSFNDRKASLPEGGVPGIKTERGQQLGVVLGNEAGLDLAVDKARVGRERLEKLNVGFEASDLGEGERECV